MKKVIFLATFILASSFFINYVYAVENHNSSRSNKTYPIAQPSVDIIDDALTLLDEAETNVLDVLPTMIKQVKATKERDEANQIKATGTATGQIKVTVKIILKVEAVD